MDIYTYKYTVYICYIYMLYIWYIFTVYVYIHVMYCIYVHMTVICVHLYCYTHQSQPKYYVHTSEN